MKRIKHTLIFLFLLCFLASGQEREVCKKFTPELVKSIKTELESFELELMEKGYLRDEKASSFMLFLRENANTGFQNLNRTSRPILDQNIYDLLFNECALKLESGEDFEALLAFQLRHASKVNEFQESIGDSLLTPTMTGTFIADLVTEKDLESPSIRRRLLLTLIGVIMPNDNNSNTITLLGDDNEKKPTTNYVTRLRLDANNGLFLDNLKGDSTVISKALDEMVRQYENDLTIIIEADKNTSYDTFLDIMDIVILLYQNLYNEKSQERYGLSFDELSSQNKREIERRFQKNVIIRHPKN